MPSSIDLPEKLMIHRAASTPALLEEREMKRGSDGISIDYGQQKQYLKE